MKDAADARSNLRRGPFGAVDRAKAVQVSMPSPVSLAVSSITSGLVGWAALALFKRRPPSRAPQGIACFRQRRQDLIAPRLGPTMQIEATPRGEAGNANSHGHCMESQSARNLPVHR
jgi:hypothetical protein